MRYDAIIANASSTDLGIERILILYKKSDAQLLNSAEEALEIIKESSFRKK